MKAKAFEIKVGNYPNGSTFGNFHVDGEMIGSARQEEGGWVILMGRKVMSAELAAKVMLDKRITEARQQLAECERLRNILRTHCGGRFPSK